MARKRKVTGYINGDFILLSMDPTTRAAYDAGTSTSGKVAAVISSLADPVTVQVKDGSGAVVGSGTMSTPWATVSGNKLVVGQVSSFSISTTSTPTSSWRLRFSSGSNWVEGSFGLSGTDFVWSLPTWEIGTTVRIGTVQANTWIGTAEREVNDWFDIAAGNTPFGWLSLANKDLGTYNAGVGGTYNLRQDANIPSGTTATFNFVSPPVSGILLDSTFGTLSIGTNALAGSYILDISISNGTVTQTKRYLCNVATVSVSRFEFADLPEIVFVRNIPESDDLAPFIIDTNNRIWPGDLGWLNKTNIKRHPDHPLGQGTWTASQPVTVEGTLPDGVAFDPVYCKLVYTPSNHSPSKSTISETATIRLKMGSVLSDPFNVRILVPTIVYGYGATARNAEMGWNVPASNVMDPLYATTNSGTIDIGPSSGTVNISHVKFTGAARAVITVGAGSTAVVSKLTVPNSSTITGTGTLIYEGVQRTLPYTIPNKTDNAGITWFRAVKQYRSVGDGVNYSTPNVMYTTPGTYNEASGEDFSMPSPSNTSSGIGTFYLLGDPVSMPNLIANSVFKVAQYYADLMYVKNFDTTRTTFPIVGVFSLETEATYGKRPYSKYITKINQHDSVTGNDGIAAALAEETSGSGPAYPGTKIHLWNLRQSVMGGNDNTKHSMYLEGRPFNQGRINNIFIDGTRLCSAIQSTLFDIAILNSRLYVVPGADPAYTGYRSTDMIDIHSCNYATIYNNWVVAGASKPTASDKDRGCLSGPVFLESRRALFGGNDVPPYPNAVWQRIPDDGPSFVPWSTTIDNVGLGGTYGDLGVAQYGPTWNGPWTNLSTPAVYVGSQIIKNWRITVQPGEIPNGFHFLRFIRNGGLVASDRSSNPKHLRVYQTATDLAATTFWKNDYGVVQGFDMDSLATYLNPAFWDAVAATTPATDMKTPLRYRHFYAYNVFERLSFTGEIQRAIPLTRVKGTQPVQAVAMFSGNTIVKRAPFNFAERSTAYWCNNRLINWPTSGDALFDTRTGDVNPNGTMDVDADGNPVNLYEIGNIWSQADIAEMGANPANYPRCVHPTGVPDRPYFDLGGNNFADPASSVSFVGLPADFKINKPQG